MGYTGPIQNKLNSQNETQMIKKVPISFLVFWLLVQLGCKKAPTYNPFDQEFDISISHVVKNGCDTLSAGCGYYNLIEKSTSSRMYYQIYSDDFHEVVAKGYVYHIDTFRFKSREDFYNEKQIIKDSIIQFQFNINNLNQKIEKYDYSYLDRKKNTIRILSKENQDTVVLKFNIAETDHPRYFVRNLEYFEGSPKLDEEK